MAETRDVFVISKNGEKTYWNKCGRAFVNADGSLNVRLDLPSFQWARRRMRCS
jgi:hypothetical protein